MPQVVPKFVQIVTGTWNDQEKKLNHSVYALGENGKVYKFFVNEGWVIMEKREGKRYLPAEAQCSADGDF